MSRVIGNWMRNRNTVEYLGFWETLYNPDFKPLEFEEFRKEAGLAAHCLENQLMLVIAFLFCLSYYFYEFFKPITDTRTYICCHKFSVIK